MLADNTLTHGADGEDSVTDGFAVIVTDSDGSSVNASLDVRIIDDVPAARDDVDSVTEDGAAPADGNVPPGLGGGEIGSASCRERVCKSVSISVVAVASQTKHTSTATRDQQNAR